MFNNQGNPTRRLARRSIRANRRRNLAVILTIALTSCVLAVIALSVAASQRISYDNKVVRGWNLEARGVTYEHLEELGHDPEINRVGIKRNLGMIHLADATVKIAYYDPVMWAHNQNEAVTGSYPDVEGEVGISTSYLELLGVEAGLGDTVRLDLGHGLRDYTITTLLDATGAGSYYVFVPRSSYDEFARSGDGRHLVYLWLNGVDPANRQEIEAAARRLEQRYDLGDGFVSTYTPAFQHSLHFSAPRYIAYTGIGLAICAAGAVVIYTIFFISVDGRIREFGQMRTLGASRFQIRQFVFLEGMMLAPPSVLAGLLTGGLIAYLIAPVGWYWPASFLLDAIIAAVCLSGVFVGLAKPARVAAEASPMEALRHSGYRFGVQGKHRVSHKMHRTTPVRLARMNFTRSPQKTVLTLTSLGICGVLLICGASIQSTLTPEAVARAAMPYGNFKIRLTEDTFLLGPGSAGRDEDRVQLEGNPLDAELLALIEEMDGVLEVKRRAGIFGNVYAQEGETLIQAFVYGYDESDYPRMEASLTGIAAFDPERPEAVLVVRAPETFQEVYGWMPKIGEVVQMEYLDRTGEYRVQDFRITGLIGKSDGIDHFFRVPATLLEGLAGYNISMEWYIRTNPEMDESIEEALLLLLQERSNLTLETYSDRIGVEAGSQMYGTLYALVGIFGMFGLINLINTTVTNLLARRQEMALYRALGMTARQLIASLLTEGAVYTINSILAMLILGTPVAMLVCKLSDPTGAMAYQFPVLAVLAYAVVLLLAQVLLLLHAQKNYIPRELAKTIAPECQ